MATKEKNIGESKLRNKPKIPFRFKLKDKVVTLDSLDNDLKYIILNPGEDKRIFTENPLPWFEFGEPDPKTLIAPLEAWYADDGSIRDIGMNEETGEIWVEITDGEPEPEPELEP